MIASQSGQGFASRHHVAPGQPNCLVFRAPQKPQHKPVTAARQHQGTVSRGYGSKQALVHTPRQVGVCRAEIIDAEASDVNPVRKISPVEQRDGELIEDENEEDPAEAYAEGEEEYDEEDPQLTEEEFAFLMDQPNPTNLQHTLYKSFVLESICQHGGHQSCVKVKPAYANEGRYFVVVPHGSIPPPEDYPPEAEAKLKEIQEALEAEKEGRSPPGGKTARDLEEDLSVDIEPDELTARAEDDQVIVPSLETANIIPENAMFLTLEQGEERIINAETLLASLEALGIDNARIEIEAKEDASRPLEVPCPDGSASVWSDFIKFAGVRYAPGQDGTEHVPKKRIIPSKVISVRDGESFIQLIPSKLRRVSVGLDYTEQAPVIGAEFVTWSPEDALTDHWRWTIAPARPFIVSPEIGEAMQAEGYYKGAGDESVAVANWTSWNDESTMRYEDEPARRRLLEFVADLSLISQNGSGGIPEGHIVAFSASRELQLRFLRALLKNSEIIDDSSEVPPEPVEEDDDEEQ